MGSSEAGVGSDWLLGLDEETLEGVARRWVINTERIRSTPGAKKNVGSKAAVQLINRTDHAIVRAGVIVPAVMDPPTKAQRKTFRESLAGWRVDLDLAKLVALSPEGGFKDHLVERCVPLLTTDDFLDNFMWKYLDRSREEEVVGMISSGMWEEFLSMNGLA